MVNTGFFYDDLFLKHDTGPGHPETAGRLTAIMDRLTQQSYYGKLQSLPERFATPDEIALIHTPDYIHSVKQVAESTGGYLDGDTMVSAKSYDAALLASGAGLAAADSILDSSIDRAFLIVRPPGHHCLPDRAMGFCLFNNIAITARYLQKQGLSRIAILDWDVHHGNGTEAVFYNDPSVLFISMHQYPFYPGTGAATDRGRGAGDGYTLNVPMPAGADEEDYKEKFTETVIPKLEQFAPDILLISAGFDAHHADPLAMIDLQTSSFEWMTAMVSQFSRSFSGRIISFLEGGYNFSALAESVDVHVAALQE